MRLQPVFVVGLHAVELAIAIGDVAAAAQDLIVVVHVVHPMVLDQRLLERGTEEFAGLIREAQHSDAQAAQLHAEVVAIGRQVRRRCCRRSAAILLHLAVACKWQNGSGPLAPGAHP